ncbi:hypothetical protein [Paenibacillus taichungensis]|uniref:hypothetical protein n=1 Tax=Paenibacillus taichungensis TaxID=484184 RepID=UPI0038D10099
MSSIMIGAGQELGKFQHKDGLVHYGVQFEKQRLLLEEHRYKVWQVAQMASYSVEKFTVLLDLESHVIQGHIDALKEQGLVFESRDILSTSFRTKHIAITKGYIELKNDGEFELTEFLGAPPVSLPLITATVWRLANPLFSLESLVDNLVQVMDMPKVDILVMLSEAIIFLVSNGFMAIDRLPEA